MTRLGRSGRVAVAIGGLAAALSSCSTPEAAGPRRIVVVDAVAMPWGDGTVGAPWLNLDAALEQGGPGVEIHLRPGLYRGPFRTSSGGSQGAPLRIVGSEGATLVAAEDETNEDEEEPEERGEQADRLQPKRADEQLCPSCFLLVRQSAPMCPVGDDECPLFSR